MKRLTKATDNLTFLCDHLRRETMFDSQRVKDIHDRLAAYEDTELEPEEIKAVQKALDGIPFGRFREIMEAERDGRCVVLPCIPYGKTIYWIWGNEIMPTIYKGIQGGTVTKDGVYHVSCNMITKKPRSFRHTYRRKAYTNTFEAGDKRMFYADDIGKTVFLTREAAKAALKAGEPT